MFHIGSLELSELRKPILFLQPTFWSTFSVKKKHEWNFRFIDHFCSETFSFLHEFLFCCNWIPFCFSGWANSRPTTDCKPQGFYLGHVFTNFLNWNLWKDMFAIAIPILFWIICDWFMLFFVFTLFLNQRAFVSKKFSV